MSTETIMLELDSEAAQVFKSATAEERDKLAVLLGVWLKQYGRADAAPLKETMNDISSEARARGLTPEILDSVLGEK